MKTFFMLTIICGMLICGCNNSSTTPKGQIAVDNVPVGTAEGPSCFRFIAKRDTFDISYTRSGDSIMGTMHFNHFEKDKSSGTIRGIASGDTLKLFYNFQAEGTTSIRQIYLKQNGDQLITGTGDEYTTGDSALLSAPSKIVFNGIAYKKRPCM